MRGIIYAVQAPADRNWETDAVCTYLQTVHDRPMIYYPLSTLMLAGVRDIILICAPWDILMFQDLLGDGSQWGVKLSYAEQSSADGAAWALTDGSEYSNGHSCALILGHNLFFGQTLSELLPQATARMAGTTVIAYKVSDPERHVMIEFDDQQQAMAIEERPREPKSRWAATGLYFYNQDVFPLAAKLKSSSAERLTILNLNREFIKRGNLTVVRLDRGVAWLEASTPEAVVKATNFCIAFEKQQKSKIPSPETIAFDFNWISAKTVLKLAQKYKGDYGNYLYDFINKS